MYCLFLGGSLVFSAAGANTLEPIRYNNPGLVVDLGVGLWAWPVPVDADGDGVPDLLIGAEDGHLYFLKNLRTK